MKLVFPIGAMILATASCCCCGDLFNTLMEKAGIDNPMASSGGYGDVPSDLSELPSYPGAEFFAGGSYGGTSTANWYVDGATPAQVVKYYRSNLESDGWSIDSTIDIDVRDWLHLQDDGVILNHSKMKKYGFTVGELLITIIKDFP